MNKIMNNQNGGIAIITALLLTAFLGLAALGIDSGYMVATKNELQNAADAGALAGAWQLSKGGDENAIKDTAKDTVGQNKASNGNISLELSDITIGKWDLEERKFTISSLEDANAVKVSIQNHDLNLFFRSDNESLGAEAVAIVGSAGTPDTVDKGILLPLAISKWIADKADEYNSPSNTVKIGSDYHYDNDPYNDVFAGQWTSFTEDKNNAKYLKGLITNGNPDPLSVGDSIYIQPGTMAFGYHEDYLGLYVGKNVVFALVDAVLRDETKKFIPVYSFISFRITNLLDKNKKGIEGYFVEDIYAGGGGASGNVPYYGYGINSSPKLVQ